jgi:tetratricopeptide (TPR) repeat protein
MRTVVVAVLTLFALEALAQEEDAPPPETEAPPAEAEATPEAHPEREEADLRTRSADLARQRGRLEDALRDYRLAEELDPSAARSLRVIEMLDALRRDAELVAAYGAFLERYPSHPRAGELQARLGVAEGALPAAEDASPPPEPEVALRPEEAASEGEEGSGSVLDETWFWGVIVGVVVVGLFAVLLTTQSQGVEAPLPGDEGVVVLTLTERF